MKKKITIVVVTYQTNKNILLKCLKSIDKDIKIIIIENSKRFENKTFFTRKFKNLKERILKEKDTLFYIVIDEGNKPLQQRDKP